MSWSDRDGGTDEAEPMTSDHSAGFDSQGPIEKVTRRNYGRAGIAPLARSWSCNHDQTIAEPAGEVCTPS